MDLEIITREQLNNTLGQAVALRDRLLCQYVVGHPEENLNDIAAKFTLTQPEVSRIIHKNGIRRPRGWSSPACKGKRK